MRNLGFEDTPDYDYLRELFTQALKNTGEVEDGEYDWMKINNGKGWEAMKHSSQHLHAANAVPNSSARALGGGTDTPRGPGTPGINHLRLNAGQPLPPSPAKPGASKTRERTNAAANAAGVNAGAPLAKRQSGALGNGLSPGDMGTPTDSMHAQFHSSTANLGQHRISSTNAIGAGAAGQGNARTAGADPLRQGGNGIATRSGPGAQRGEEPASGGGGMQKFLKAICCSR